jgi:20S proteasome subunit alpha 5
LALAFGEGSTEKAQMSRPFGVALLFAGVDKNGPSLYSLDPSGTYVRCDAKAIGSGAEGAQGSLGDIYHADISLKEATKHALTILKQVMEEKLTATNVELATVTKADGFKVLTDDEVKSEIEAL